MRRVNSNTRICPGSANTATRLSIVAAVPRSGSPVTIIQPIQIPARREGAARRLAIASPIASRGGASASHPNVSRFIGA